MSTIIFDLAEVCLQGLLGVEKVIAPALGVEEADICPKHLIGPHIYALFRGHLSEVDYLRRVMETGRYPDQVGIEPTIDFLKRAIRSNFTPIPGTLDLAARLGQRGHQVGLLSDHAREWINYCEAQFPLADVFVDRIYSFETGHVKEEVESFEAALDRLGASPNKTLFIDDRPINLQVARQAGIWNTYQFTDAESLEQELLRHHLL